MHTAAEEAKYAESRPHITLTPSTCQLSLEASHSLSGSHLRDRHAVKTWKASMELVAAPKTVMTSEADLDG